VHPGTPDSPGSPDAPRSWCGWEARGVTRDTAAPRTRPRACRHPQAGPRGHAPHPGCPPPGHSGHGERVTARCSAASAAIASHATRNGRIFRLLRRIGLPRSIRAARAALFLRESHNLRVVVTVVDQRDEKGAFRRDGVSATRAMEHPDPVRGPGDTPPVRDATHPGVCGSPALRGQRDTPPVRGAAHPGACVPPAPRDGAEEPRTPIARTTPNNTKPS
jgi:hypothetical protein